MNKSNKNGASPDASLIMESMVRQNSDLMENNKNIPMCFNKPFLSQTNIQNGDSYLSDRSSYTGSPFFHSKSDLNIQDSMSKRGDVNTTTSMSYPMKMILNSSRGQDKLMGLNDKCSDNYDMTCVVNFSECESSNDDNVIYSRCDAQTESFQNGIFSDMSLIANVPETFVYSYNNNNLTNLKKKMNHSKQKCFSSSSSTGNQRKAHCVRHQPQKYSSYNDVHKSLSDDCIGLLPTAENYEVTHFLNHYLIQSESQTERDSPTSAYPLTSGPTIDYQLNEKVGCLENKKFSNDHSSLVSWNTISDLNDINFCKNTIPDKFNIGTADYPVFSSNLICSEPDYQDHDRYNNLCAPSMNDTSNLLINKGMAIPPLTLMKRLEKTQLCRHFKNDRTCFKNQDCPFAHGTFELRPKPILFKTKLCSLYKLNRCTKGFECLHAHSDQELRTTPEFYKTSLCSNFKKSSSCLSGAHCRFAHGIHELRNPFGT